MAKQHGKTDEELAARMDNVVDQNAAELSEETNGFDIFLAPLSWWRENWKDLKVQKLFIENFIKIRSKHSENKLIPFRFNDVQNDLHFKMSGKDVILKSRQQGVSTYVLALKLSNAIMFSGRNIRFVPHDEQAEKEFWTRLKTMYEKLPANLKPQTSYYSKDLIEFKDVSKDVEDSKLVSLKPGSGYEDKMRSLTLTDAHLTEIPFWKGDQEKVFTALMAAAEKGNITLECTAQGKEKFYSYYQMGKTGKNGWRSHFYEWWWLRENKFEGYRFAKLNDGHVLLEPDQSILDVWNFGAKTPEERLENQKSLREIGVTEDEQKTCEMILAHLKRKKYVGKHEHWHCKEVAEYLAWRRAKIFELGGGKDLKRGLKLFLIEHPENDIDCFDSSTLTVVSPEYLKVTCEGIDIDAKGAELDKIAAWLEGKRFIVAADTSLGKEGSDPAAIEVLDIDTGRQAYSEELLMSPDLLAHRILEVSDFFNFAKIGVENNSTGGTTLKELARILPEGDERIFTELTVALQIQVEDGKLTKEEAFLKANPGITTTKKNKPLYELYLEPAIRTGEVSLSSEGWCTQAQTVVWLNTQKSEWGAMTGHHDDRFIALAIANYIRELHYEELTGFIGVMPVGGDARAG